MTSLITGYRLTVLISPLVEQTVRTRGEKTSRVVEICSSDLNVKMLQSRFNQILHLQFLRGERVIWCDILKKTFSSEKGEKSGRGEGQRR